MWNKIIKAFRTNTLIGLFLLAPLVGTLWIVNLVIIFVSNHIVPSLWLASRYAPFFRIAALVVVVAALYFVGLLTRNFIGKKVYRLTDWILTHIPVISSVYTSIRQISESLVSTRSTLFKDVVAVQFPRLGLYSIGFVTSYVPGAIAHKIEPGDNRDMVCVFVPTAPNPTTGFLLMMAKSEIIYLNISIAAAMKMVISGGAASPWKDAAVPQQTLLDYIEAWIQRGENVSATLPAENKPADPNK